MDKQEAPDDSPPAYDAEVVRHGSTSNPDPPPPYPPLELELLFPPPTVSQFPPRTGQPTIPYPPPDVYYVGLPQQPTQPLHQQQQVVFASSTRSQPVSTTVPRVQSFAGHIVFACVVTFFCNPVFGLVAFILAVVAHGSAVSNEPRARKLGRASVGLSITGIVVSVAIVAVVVVALFITVCHSYRYGGACYEFKTYVGSSGSCDGGGAKSSDGYCYSKYCYDYAYRTSCYKYRTYIGPLGTCSGVTSNNYCYYAVCQYSYRSSCYEYKTYVGRSGSCFSGIKSSAGYCYSSSCPYHPYADSCYRYKRYVGSSGTCNGVKSENNYCYFTSCAGYTYLGNCYKYKKYVGPSGSCTGGVKLYSGYCYSNF